MVDPAGDTDESPYPFGQTDLWTMRPDGSAGPDLVLDHDVDIAETAWSGDGRWILYRTESLIADPAVVLAE